VRDEVALYKITEQMRLFVFQFFNFIADKPIKIGEKRGFNPVPIIVSQKFARIPEYFLRIGFFYFCQNQTFMGEVYLFIKYHCKSGNLFHFLKSMK